MNILRRIGLSITIFIFSSCIWLVAIFISLYAVFETPDTLKTALRTSGAYSVVSQTAPTAMSTQADPQIEQALVGALSPQFVQNSSEQAIDSVYSWAQGRSPNPDFSIDMSSIRTTFADNIAKYLQQKIDSLPPCTDQQAASLPTTDTTNLTCKPQGIPTATLVEQARQEILNSSFFSDNAALNTATLKGTDGRPLSEQFAFVPTLHHYFVISLYVLPFLCLLCAIAIVFWSTNKRAGMKRVAWILISIGITNALLSLAGTWLLQMGTGQAATVQDKLLAVVKILSIDLNNWLVGFGVGYTVVGIILLVSLRLQKKPGPLATVLAEEPPTDELPPVLPKI